jgi:Co/Zn/Cd efflux system component
MLLAGTPLVSLIRNPQRGPAAKAQMWELVNDELGLVAALVGTLLAVLGYQRADPLAAIIIATIIIWKAVSLFRENLSLVLGRSPGAKVLDAVTEAALATPGVVGVHDLRAEYIGPDVIHLGMHLAVPRGTSIEAADEIAYSLLSKPTCLPSWLPSTTRLCRTHRRSHRRAPLNRSPMKVGSPTSTLSMWPSARPAR